jgi:hypothetical protein
LQQQDALLKTAKELERKIAKIMSQIDELSEKLVQANQDDATARAVETQIRGLKKQLARLLAEMAELQDQLDRKQKRVEELENETKNAGPLAERQKTLQEQLARTQECVKRAIAERDRLAARIDQIRRGREERDREFTIVPSKPLPPGMPKPVFVECTAGGVVIQPAGTKFGLNPTAGDRGRFLSAAGRSGFVVFLIRPGSFDSFAVYRSIVRSDGSLQFGFEPVDASWNLVYPK